MTGDHPSITDVAARAGVSPATVSRALRGLPHVSDATRQRVQEAAHELNYVASPAGSGLVSGRTMTVGVVIPYATRWFFSQILAAAEEVLRTGGYNVLLYTLGDAARRRHFFQRMPLRRRVDALLVVSVSLSDEEVSALVGLRVPVTSVGFRHEALSSVRIDDGEGTRTAVTHLRELGHTEVVMLSALEDEDLGFDPVMHRRAAFSTAAREVGFSERDRAIVGQWGVEGGVRGMEAILAGSDLPTAVFAEYDEMAFGALRALRSAGLRVPEDVSVVGFDDHELAAVVDLTTVAQPVWEQGVVAGEMLLDRLRNGDLPHQNVELATKLVVRGSSGWPRSSPRSPGTAARECR